MIQYAADIETDGLLKDLTKIHCAVLVNIETGTIDSFSTQASIIEFLQIINSQDVETVWHNGFGFDLLAIKKVSGVDLSYSGRAHDTFVLSQLLYSDLKVHDFKIKKVAPKLIGSHSLKAWGQRLDCYKGEYDGGWDACNNDMITYNIQDGIVTRNLFIYLNNQIDGRTWK
ncbi:MAG TPA: hypothetical protein VGK47_02185 [Nitrososphaeraceae archaeon]